MTTSATPYIAAIADFIDGDFHFKTTTGEHIVIKLGSAQVISAKRGMDRYVASQEVAECKANG